MVKDLIKKLNELKKSSVKKEVEKKQQQFKKMLNNSDEKVFNELCFCLMTANFNAKKAIEIQEKMENDFNSASEEKLAEKLKKHGHRFPNMRAHFISQAQKHKCGLIEKIKSFKSGKSAREWLSENVKGLGMKESSHFLRNIGFTDVAIIDFHIVDILVENKMINEPKTITKKVYLEIEKVLEKLGKKAKLNLSKLDLYLWYLETGKILK